MEGVHGPIKTAVLKAAFEENVDFLCSQFKNSQDFCNNLYTKELLTQEELDHLNLTLTNKGPVPQRKVLIGYLVKKPAQSFWKVADELKLFDLDIYDVILKTVDDIENGSVKLKRSIDAATPLEVGLAIAVVLTEEIRNILKERFHRELKQCRYGSFQDVLKNKASLVNSMKDCLFKRQYKTLLNPGKNESMDKFDEVSLMFLFTLLLDIDPKVTQHGNVMNLSDDTLVTQLTRVNILRNIAYGCLLKEGPGWVLDHDPWKLLLHTIASLGAPIENVRQYQTLVLYPDVSQLRIVKKQLQDWIGSDKNTLILVLQILDHHLSHANPKFTEVKQTCDSVRLDLDSNFSKLFAVLEEIPQNMLEAVLLHSKTLKCDPQVHAIKASSHMVREDLKDTRIHLEKVSEKYKDEIKAEVSDTSAKLILEQQIVQERLTTVCERQEKANDKLDVLHAKFDSDITEPESCRWAKEMLRSETDAFRVLVLSNPENKDHEDMETFCQALGCIGWDVIIDLDHHSRTPQGLHESVVKVLKLKKDYQVVTYNQVKNVLDTDKRITASGEKTFWLFANGCADTGVESLKKAGKALPPIEQLLESVFTKTPGKKPVFFWNMILTSSEAIPGFTQKLLQRFDDICQTAEDYIDCAQSFICSLYTEESYKSNIPHVELEEIRHTSVFLTYQDVSNMYKDELQNGEKSKCYYYPGRGDRKCEIATDQMVQYEVYFELYHLDIGNVDFTDMKEEDIEELMERERADFLKGRHLTPTAQFVHSKCQVYVEREEMRDAKSKVVKLLEDRVEWHKRKYSGHFTISHDASGGGTTTARYLMYSLKDSYACLEIKRIELQTMKYLTKIFKESRKPLLVVIDDHEYTSKNADELQQELNNDHVKALVIHVKRKKMQPLKEVSSLHFQGDLERFPDDVSENGNGSGCLQISSTLKLGDKEGFKQLYKKVAPVIKATKVILFGLLAFCEEYEETRLKEHISEGLQNSTEDQVKALTIVLSVWKYCQKPIKLKLLPTFPSDTNQVNMWEKLFGYNNSDFVKEDQNDKYAARPVHQCVVEQILESTREMSRKKGQPEFLQWFTQILFQSISRNDALIEESTLLCIHLFIERQKEGYTSLFVSELGDQCGKQFASDVIIKFATLYRGLKHESHLRALYARYLTYEMNLVKKGLQEIACAVGLRSGVSIKSGCVTNESAVLVSYGNLFRNKGHATFKAHKNFDTAITASLIFFEEAIFAFQKAQKSSLDSQKYSAEPFLGEVRVRHGLLSLCIRHKCQYNYGRFRQFLKGTKHELIRESDERALKVLETLDNLQRLNRLDEISDQTSKRIVSQKFMLLKLRFDEKKTKKALLSAADKEHNISCDIGLLVRLEYDNVGSVGEEGFRYSKKHWSDLSLKELLTIIQFVGRRLERGSDKILACNLCDHVNAMICLRYKCKAGEYPQYNIQYAIACVEHWAKCFTDDHRSFFTLGALHLVRGIDQELKREVGQGVDDLFKCEEICRANRSARGVMTRRWSFGTSTGLGKLVPYKKDMSDLEKFQGRQVTPKSKIIGVKPFQDILTAKMYGDDRTNADDGRQSNLEFNICLRQKDPIVAFNVEKA